jgi:hypothetical protein
MKSPALLTRFNPTFWLLLLFVALTQSTHAEWHRDDTTIAWRDGTNVIWRFSFDPAKGKTFFDPITVGGTALTNFKPEDHPWHYGLWFSWKYINKANYWEENRQTGKAEGATGWNAPVIVTKPDGSANIKLEVTYTHPTGRVDMMENRELVLSAPKADGSYSIDWSARFTAGKEGAVLDRTPMPGEPEGRVNGGYAGLGLRMASPPLGFSVVSSAGPVDKFESDRARPNAAAIACNFIEGSRDAGGIAIFSDPMNAGEEAPWYVVNSREMRFVCAAILAPKILTLKAGEEMKLHYRIAVRPQAWTVDALNQQSW